MIDIILPSFNQQEYLPDAIESALAQSASSVIVVDDGSTDNSLKIAEGYQSQGVRVISQTNKGLASARNTGIMNSKAQYCLFLDADDILLDGCTDKIIEVAANTQADIIAPSFKEFGLSQADVILMPNPKLEDFRNGNKVGYCQTIRRTALQHIGGYSPRMAEGYEDLHLTINLLSKGYSLVTISDILWLYRIKEESMYTNSIRYHKKLLAQINKDFPSANIDF